MVILGSILAALLGILILFLAYSFAVGIAFGAPYLPTLSRERATALKLLDLRQGQTLYDLGCGDGRMLRSAAQAGLNAVGYEISPVFWLVARIVTFRYRKQVKVVLGNYWQADLSAADGIYVFLLTKYMGKFDRKITSLKKPVRVASYTFKIPGKKPTKKAGPVYLYQY